MKLAAILESDISRRDFLKRSGGGVTAALMSGGMPAATAQAVASVSSNPVLQVMTHTWYGRGGPPMLSDQFSKVGTAARFARILSGDGDVSFGADEDSFFHSGLDLKWLSRIVGAAESGDTMRIGGADYIAFYGQDPEAGELDICLQPVDQRNGHMMYIRGDVPDWWGSPGNAIDKDENPIVAWWEYYGHYGDEPIDAAAFKFMREHGMFRSGDTETLDYENDRRAIDRGDEAIEPEEPEKPEEIKVPGDYRAASPMHQWFESRLIRALA